MPHVLGLSLVQCAAPASPVPWPGGESGGMIHSAPHFFPTASPTCKHGRGLVPVQQKQHSAPQLLPTLGVTIYTSITTSTLELSWYSLSVNTVIKYLAPTFLLLQLHFRPKVPAYYKQDWGYSVMDHALRHLGLTLPLNTGCRRLHAHGKAPKVLKLVEVLRGCNCRVLEQTQNVYVHGD